MFKIYPIPEDTLSVADNMIFKNIQPMHKEECILRVYIVRGIDLQSKDSNGKVKEITKYIFTGMFDINLTDYLLVGSLYPNRSGKDKNR